MLESWKRIKGFGIEPSFCTGRAASFAFYYRDPDQNLVDVRCEAAATPRSSRRSDILQANSAGTSVDPALVYEA